VTLIIADQDFASSCSNVAPERPKPPQRLFGSSHDVSRTADRLVDWLWRVWAGYRHDG